VCPHGRHIGIIAGSYPGAAPGAAPRVRASPVSPLPGVVVWTVGTRIVAPFAVAFRQRYTIRFERCSSGHPWRSIHATNRPLRRRGRSRRCPPGTGPGPSRPS
jgi:hypothetical protein